MSRITAVIFDLGGTLRIAKKEPEWMQRGRERMAELAETDLPVQDFYDLVEERYEVYREWALRENKESGDAELWGKWILPDYPKELIAERCHELSFQYRQSKGHRYVVDHGVEVLKELHARGYKLAIISNLIGETEVPDWLEEDGLTPYFDSVILSPVCGLRKPDPEIYRLCCREMNIDPSAASSVADNQGRDITGAREAGIGECVLFRSPEKKHPVDPDGENPPDHVINDFRELLDIYPPLETL